MYSLFKAKISTSKEDKSLSILITGGTSGIGYQSVLKLISLGHNIILPCRNVIRANETLTKIFNEFSDNLSIKGKIYTPIMNLADLNSIDSFCFELKKKGIKIDVLILNAGLQYTGSKNPRWSKQRIELTFAVNHLAHFYLTQNILPLLNKSNNTKIIITSSEVHNPLSSGGKVGYKASLGNLSGLEAGVGFKMIDGNDFNADKAYKDSKLCNILFAKELSTRLIAKKLLIPVICWAPGLVISRDAQGFFRYSRNYNKLGQLLFSFLARDLLRITSTNEKSGILLSQLVCSKKYNEQGFNYYSNKILSPGKFVFENTNVSDDANQKVLQKKLWYLSELLVKKKFR